MSTFEKQEPRMKLWFSTAKPGYGLVVVIAETWEEAVAKAKLPLDDPDDNYIPRQRYAQALLDNLGAMEEVKDGVFIDWSPSERRSS
jgi:hypothetical protein